MKKLKVLISLLLVLFLAVECVNAAKQPVTTPQVRTAKKHCVITKPSKARPPPAACSISEEMLAQFTHAPLLLIEDSKYGDDDLFFPIEKSGKRILKTGEAMRLACPGESNPGKPNYLKPFGVQEVNVKCVGATVGDIMLEVDGGRPLSFRKFECNEKARPPVCSIAINTKMGELPKIVPLLLKPLGSKDGYGFYLPQSSTGLVTMNTNDIMRLACPGKNNYFKTKEILSSKLKEIAVTCVSGTEFQIGSTKSFSFREFSCNEVPSSMDKHTGTMCHGANTELIEIGFQVGADFFKTIDVCFNYLTKNNLWSSFDLVPGVERSESGMDRPDFRKDILYEDIDIKTLYTKAEQKVTLGRILQSTDLADKYIETCIKYMAQGHLTANADFVYYAQQRATFALINAAPQWQSFNAGNWKTLESNVRQFAASMNYKLTVITGTHGVMTLLDHNNNPQGIWLYKDKHKTAVPVPEYFWKVVYQRTTGRAIAFIGVNNPFIPARPDMTQYCTYVCHKVDWLTWSPLEGKNGYAYCCEVDILFERFVQTLPFFGHVSGLLE